MNTDQDLRALSDTALAAQIDAAARAERFHGASERGMASIDAEQDAYRLKNRLLAEQFRRTGPVVQAPGTTMDKVAGLRKHHAVLLANITLEARSRAQQWLWARQRAARAVRPGDRRYHLIDAQVARRAFRGLQDERRTLKAQIRVADLLIRTAPAAQAFTAAHLGQ